MTRLVLDISVSLDGFVAGPDQTLEEPLGRGGEQLHSWVIATKAFRERHGLEGGETNLDSDLVAEGISNLGATIMGRRMFSGGEGPWVNDPNADSWFGDDPPFHHSVFVLTHHSREPVTKQGGTSFEFVTDGIETALARAREAAGGRDIRVGGGADVAQQYLRAGLLDELHVHLVPVLLGGGTRLFGEDTAGRVGELECTSVIESPTGVVHLRYRVPR